MDFLMPIFDGFGWTFNLIGGGKTGGALLFVGFVCFVVWARRFWVNAHWQPGRPMRPEVITLLREHRSTIAAGLSANMQKPQTPIFDDQGLRLSDCDDDGTRYST